MGIDLIENNLYELFEGIGRTGSCPVKELYPFRCISQSGLIWPDMNFVSPVGGEPDGAAIGMLADQIRQQGWSKTTIFGERSLTEAVQSDLRVNGFLPVAQWTNMEADECSMTDEANVGVPGAGIVDIVEVGGAREVLDWLDVVEKVLFNGKQLQKDTFLSGMESNIFKLLSVYYKGKIAATGLIFRGEVPGAYMVATDPGYRRMGLARYLMDHARRMVFKAGYKKLVLHSTREGLDFYLSLGFVARGKMTLYYLRK